MAKKEKFKTPYIGVHKEDQFYLLYGSQGEFSVIININNPVIQYGASSTSYDEFHSLFSNIIKILGEGYYVQKQDIFIKTKYDYQPADEYLQEKYNQHFTGRDYIAVKTYLTITRQVKKGTFYVYDKKVLNDFKTVIGKVLDILTTANCRPECLNEREINLYIKRILAMEFSSNNVALDNLQADVTSITTGQKVVRSISLIDIDSIDLPGNVSTHIEMNERDSLKGFPADLFSFLFKVPGFECIIFNQVLEAPSQIITINKLELKRKRHASFPDPANLICVEDIDLLMTDIARDNQLLVNAHFNILLSASPENIQQATNFIESSLFLYGIIPSRNSSNQLELFRAALPGNAGELKEYDWYLTTSDAAICFFFKEALAVDEVSNFKIRFTDRQGVPIAIDPADLPMATNRINNRNKFVLGPSGSGKSFFMNALIEQYMLYNMDVVIVDTGHSYSGLNTYYQGKYITWKDDKPITMNPFTIKEEEYNIEKKDFLVTLICLLWKGAEGKISQVEQDVISNCISSYFANYFNFIEFPGLTESQEVNIAEDVIEKFNIGNLNNDDVEFKELYDNYIALIENHKEQYIPKENDLKSNLTPLEIEINLIRDKLIISNKTIHNNYVKALKKEIQIAKHNWNLNKITELNFNSFYEFSIRKIPEIMKTESISFEIDEYRYVLKKFYKGGEFQAILNEEADQSLFNERFIVFEIDNVKENKVLFPIVTLIIMDVFIQKMRHRNDYRKALIIEEAWKAIASPLMAGYILYLYKTVRKFWGEAIVVTQELGDIIGNTVVKDSIVNNSDTICLLDQTKFKDNYKEIAALLSINEVERKKIFTINQLDNTNNRGRFKEVYIRRGATGEVYGVEVSLEQYLTYTTEKPEKSAISIYTEAYGSYQEGLDNFVSDFKQSKLSLGNFVTKINKQGTPLTPTLKITA